MDQARVELTGRIILRSSELESTLRRAGASGAGLHELTESLAGTMPEDLAKKLHFIAAIRNRAAHESADKPLEAADGEAFEQACCEVLGFFNAEEVPAPAVPLEIPDVEEEEEEVAPEDECPGRDFDRFFRKAALIPVAHILYPLYLLVISFRHARAPGAGLSGYFLFIIFLTVAVQTGDKPWLWPAGVFFFGSWLYGAFDGWRRRKVDELPQMLYLAPGINILYFLYRVAQLTDKLRFFGALSMLGAIFSATYLMICYHEYRAGLIVLAAGYAVGAIMALAESYQARAIAAEKIRSVPER